MGWSQPFFRVVEKMKNLKCLAILLVGLVPTFAFAKAKVEPLQFAGASTHDQNQARWDSLMKYKIWGTDSIAIYDKVHIPDSIGYTGTKGKLRFENPAHTLGGPILVGKNLVFNNTGSDVLIAGPVRVEDSLVLDKQDGNKLPPVWCVKNSITAHYTNNFAIQWNNLIGSLYTNETNGIYTKKAGGYTSCPSDVPPLEDLDVPYLGSWPSVSENFLMTATVAETGYIHVPPDSVETNSYGTYDKYYDRFEVSGTLNKTLYVLMPPNGKLTRIFAKQGFNLNNAVNNFKIQVAYVKEGTKFENGKWDLTHSEEFKYLSNAEYSGNLLFYTDRPINWNYWQNASFQGTWITKDTIGVGGHFKLAGQLVAKYVRFFADITGDFKYMPFDPPWIDINPEARTWGTLYEGLSGKQTLTIRLNEAPTTDVTFKYCFIFSGDQANNRDTDPDSLHAFASLDDVVTSDLPICSSADTSSYKTGAGSSQKKDFTYLATTTWTVPVTPAVVEAALAEEKSALEYAMRAGALVWGDSTEGDPDGVAFADYKIVLSLENPITFALGGGEGRAVFKMIIKPRQESSSRPARPSRAA